MKIRLVLCCFVFVVQSIFAQVLKEEANPKDSIENKIDFTIDLIKQLEVQMHALNEEGKSESSDLYIRMDSLLERKRAYQLKEHKAIMNKE